MTEVTGHSCRERHRRSWRWWRAMGSPGAGNGSPDGLL